jgi:hypothetical protein
MRTGAEAVDYIAQNYSISPQLLLALLEYQTGALTQPQAQTGKYMLGFRRVNYESPYLQLIIAANTLNNGYYKWRSGNLTELELLDETLFRPDPWQNAGSVALEALRRRAIFRRHRTGRLGACLSKLFWRSLGESCGRPARESPAACSSVSFWSWADLGIHGRTTYGLGNRGTPFRNRFCSGV